MLPSTGAALRISVAYIIGYGGHPSFINILVPLPNGHELSVSQKLYEKTTNPILART
jgi:hypothetical protein